MTGTINYGSVVFDKVVPVSDLRVGDVITYQPPAGSGVDHMETHRIVAIHGDVFRTQGDAVPQRDPWKFKLDHPTQARVAFSVPYVGYAFLWLADRDSRMLAIGLPAALIALLSLWQIVTILRGKDEQSPGSLRTLRPTVGAGEWLAMLNRILVALSALLCLSSALFGVRDLGGDLGRHRQVPAISRK